MSNLQEEIINEQQDRKNKKSGWIVLLVVAAVVALFFRYEWRKLNPTPRDLVRRRNVKSPGDTSMKIEAWTMAQSFVKKQLKSPSTADFGGLWGGDYQDPEMQVMYLVNDEYMVTGWVDAQNYFGATVRTDFIIKLKYNRDDSWSLLELPLFVQR